MNDRVLGKIEKITYGMGGYDDAMFGLSVTLSLDGGSLGTQTFEGTWVSYTEGPRMQYSREDWERNHLKTVFFAIDLLKQAKRRYVHELVGVPVEAEFEKNTLKSWRILTEVI